MNITNEICVKFSGLDETLGSKHTPFYQKSFFDRDFKPFVIGLCG